jgi:hypothetical protein
MGVRDGIADSDSAGEVLFIDAMSVMAKPMNLAVRGCAERA